MHVGVLKRSTTHLLWTLDSLKSFCNLMNSKPICSLHRTLCFIFFVTTRFGLVGRGGCGGKLLRPRFFDARSYPLEIVLHSTCTEADLVPKYSNFFLDPLRIMQRKEVTFVSTHSLGNTVNFQPSRSLFYHKSGSHSLAMGCRQVPSHLWSCQLPVVEQELWGKEFWGYCFLSPHL